jgi:hypothetical protein
MKKIILIVVVVFCFVLICNQAGAQTQAQQVYFKSVTKKLINYLLEYDTAGIHDLFDEDKRYYGAEDGIEDDSKLMSIIVKKYGVGVLDSMRLEKGENDENVVVVTLLNTPDSSLNLKKCELVVFFYPDRFLAYSKKVLNYIIARTFLKERGRNYIQ